MPIVFNSPCAVLDSGDVTWLYLQLQLSPGLWEGIPLDLLQPHCSGLHTLLILGGVKSTLSRDHILFCALTPPCDI